MAKESVPVPVAVVEEDHDAGDTGMDAAEAAMLRLLEQDDSPDTPQDEEPDEDASTTPDADEDEDEVVEGEDAPEAPVVTAPAKHKVKVRGQEMEVTLEEALNGYSRTEDYTRDKMALADEKRAIADERARYVQKLEAAEALLTEQYREPDWDELQQTLTPEEFASEHARWSVQQRRLDKVRQEKEREVQALSRDWQERQADLLRQEQQSLLEAVPAWRDEVVRDRQQKELAAYAMTIGYTTEQLSKITSHRDMLVLHHAAQFDKLQRKAATATPVNARQKPNAPVAPSKPNAIPRAGTPANQKSNYAKAMTRLRSTGSLDDAAAALAELL